ncbi:hypothetical protein [Ramlibacter sp.]|nr:hypothetical protein [Ramlibacter sp.]MBA2673996.1 hypothetical protein [Ramlibacter sp.]
MPSPLGKTKKTGDVHLPDVESDLPLQEDIGAGESSDEARPAAASTKPAC